MESQPLNDAEAQLLNGFEKFDDKEKMQFMIATILLLFDDDQIKILIRQLEQRVQ